MKNKFPKLLISTDKHISVFDDGIETILHDYLHSYYGLTWNKTNIFVATKTSLLKLDKKFNVDKSIDLNVKSDVHQICYIEDKLFVVETGFKKISVFTDTLELLVEHPISTAVHINSIFFENSKFFVCDHDGNERTNQKKSRIMIFEENFNLSTIIEEVGSANHNVYLENGFLYTLNSGEGSLIKINVNTNTKETVQIEIKKDKELIFLRGFARTKDFFILGICRNSSRVDRNLSVSYIIFLDNDLNFVESFPLEHKGQIREIRVISEYDYAHNGIKYPLL